MILINICQWIKYNLNKFVVKKMIVYFKNKNRNIYINSWNTWVSTYYKDVLINVFEKNWNFKISKWFITIFT